MSQNIFAGGYRKTGGKPSRVASRVVKCDHCAGSSTSCNFNTSPAICIYMPEALVPEAGNDHFDVGSVDGVERLPMADRTGDVRATDTAGAVVRAEVRGQTLPPTGDMPPIEPVVVISTPENERAANAPDLAAKDAVPVATNQAIIPCTLSN